MTEAGNMRCINCSNFVNKRPCPICGGNTMQFSTGPLVENVPIADFVQRQVEGERSKKNNYAIFAFIAVVSFEAYLISLSSATYLIIHWLLSLLIVVAGSYAIVRIEDFLRVTTRNMFPLHEEVQNQNIVRRQCNNCSTIVQNERQCPNCGQHDFSIIAVINEATEISESSVLTRSHFFTKTNLMGFGIFCVLFGIQWYVAYLFGGMINLPISILMGLIAFIPSYYMFFKFHFVDKEHLV